MDNCFNSKIAYKITPKGQRDKYIYDFLLSLASPIIYDG